MKNLKPLFVLSPELTDGENDTVCYEIPEIIRHVERWLRDSEGETGRTMTISVQEFTRKEIENFQEI